MSCHLRFDEIINKLFSLYLKIISEDHRWKGFGGGQKKWIVEKFGEAQWDEGSVEDIRQTQKVLLKL